MSHDQRPRIDRTWLCSVVFVDIVRYSEQSVEVQMEWKRCLEGHVRGAIEDVPEADRVILDTGDGAAICFLGDPEPAMFAALQILAALAGEDPRTQGPLRARIGVNLGPVKLVKDLNGNVNAIGDGMNAAQRVMSFAGENQILVSRSFYEVASCLSESYRPLFSFGGIRRDKHVREHLVYELHPPGATGVGTPASALPPTGSPLGDAEVERIARALAPILGPIAPHMVRATARRHAGAAEVCHALLEHVPTRDERERFLSACGLEAKNEGAPGAAAGQGTADAPPGHAHRGAPRAEGNGARGADGNGAALLGGRVGPTSGASPGGAGGEEGAARNGPAGSAGNGAAATAGAFAGSGGVDPAWEPALLDTATRALAASMGPVARVLVVRAAARAQSEEELLDLLAAAIPSPAEREAFRRAQGRPARGRR
jgi:class 3 adenylate cyclase